MADDFGWQLRHRDLFGDDVDAYDAGRPGYPAKVFELLADRCGLDTRTRVLEVGPGTGQATAQLLARGAHVTAVELNPQMAGRLKAKHPNVDVIVAPFETADIGDEPFDLVVAATSFHWITPAVAYRRAADALQEGGWLVVWWNVFGDPHHADSFHLALVELLKAHAPELIDPGTLPYGLDTAARIADFETSGRFGPVERHVLRWTGRHSAGELRTFFASQSPWLALEPARRAWLLDEVARLAAAEFGGVVERPYLTAVYLAKLTP
ncbi:MAG: trans-aconitate 2-methyltransferase [Acidimicrobiia bacterium]